MSNSSELVIYQLKIVLLSISPMIWRRLLVSSDSTIKDLHYTVQLAMGWSDIHLHHFLIHGKQYGIIKPGGTVFSDRASEVKLASKDIQFGNICPLFIQILKPLTALSLMSIWQ